jgi:hypothetical protein
VAEVLESAVMGPNLNGADALEAQFQTLLQLLRTALCALQASLSATDFSAAMNRLNLLYPIVLTLVHAPGVHTTWSAQVAALPWQDAIKRFVALPPKSAPDLRVFDAVLTVAAELLDVALLSDGPLAAFLVSLPKEYLLHFLHRSSCQAETKESIHRYVWRITTTLQRTEVQMPVMTPRCVALMKDLSCGSSIDLDATILTPMLAEAALPDGACSSAIKCLNRLSELSCMAKAVNDNRVEMVRVLVAALTRPRIPNCFHESHVIKEALGALHNMAGHMVDNDGGRLWSPLGSMHWLLRLHTDREHRVQALAASLLVRLVDTSDAAATCLGPHPALLQDVLYVAIHEPGHRDCHSKREACVGVLNNLAFLQASLAVGDGEGLPMEQTAIWLPEVLTALPELLACQEDPGFLLVVLSLTRNLLLWQTHTLLEVLVAGDGAQLLLSCLSLRQPDNTMAAVEVHDIPSALNIVSRPRDFGQQKSVQEERGYQLQQRYKAVFKTLQLISAIFDLEVALPAQPLPSAQARTMAHLIRSAVRPFTAALLGILKEVGAGSSSADLSLASAVFTLLSQLAQPDACHFRHLVRTWRAPGTTDTADSDLLGPEWLLESAAHLLHHSGATGNVFGELPNSVCGFLCELVTDVTTDPAVASPGRASEQALVQELLEIVRGAYEPMTRSMAVEALCGLLVVSPAAKRYTVEAALTRLPGHAKHENIAKWCVEQLQALYTHISTSQLHQVEYDTAGDERRLVDLLDVVASALFASDTDIKDKYVEHGLTRVLTKLWVLTLSTRSLLSNLLPLLVNCLAGCTSAKKAVMEEHRALNGQRSLLAKLMQLLQKKDIALTTYQQTLNCMQALAQHPPITSAFIRANVLLESLQTLEASTRARKYSRVLATVGFISASARCEEGQNFLAKNMGPSSFATILDLLTFFGPPIEDIEGAPPTIPLEALPASVVLEPDEVAPLSAVPSLFVTASTNSSVAKARTKVQLPIHFHKMQTGKVPNLAKALKSSEKENAGRPCCPDAVPLPVVARPSPPPSVVPEQALSEEMLSALVSPPLLLPLHLIRIWSKYLLYDVNTPSLPSFLSSSWSNTWHVLWVSR